MAKQLEVALVDPTSALQLIADRLESPNVSDSNGETANLVDTTHDIAKGLFAVARAIRGLPGWSAPEDENHD